MFEPSLLPPESVEPSLCRATRSLQATLALQSGAPVAVLQACVLLPPPASSPAVADHICKHAVTTGHTGAQLAVPNHARVDVVTLSVISHEESAAQCSFTRITCRKQCVVMLVPVSGIIETSLLDPA